MHAYIQTHIQSVIVDGVEAEKRAEPITMTDVDGVETEHILYEALASNPDLADVLVKATSSRALVNAGRSDGTVEMPSGSGYSITWNRPVTLPYGDPKYLVNEFGAEYTEVVMKVRGNSNSSIAPTVSYLRIYQPDSNAQMARFTMEYVDDLGVEGKSVVYYNADTGKYFTVLPSTAVSGVLTGYTQHPMASIWGTTDSTATSGTIKKGIYDLNMDFTTLGSHSTLGTYFHVTSSDGNVPADYQVDVYFADVLNRDKNKFLI